MDKELNVRGIVRPEISVKGNVTPQVTMRGEVQKGVGTGVGMIVKTKEEWAQLRHVMSKKNMFYVYSNYRIETNPDTGEEIWIPRVKIGDGSTYVVDLPFTTMSITDEDIARWDDHVGVYVDEETHNMIFYH